MRRMFAVMCVAAARATECDAGVQSSRRVCVSSRAPRRYQSMTTEQKVDHAKRRTGGRRITVSKTEIHVQEEGERAKPDPAKADRRGYRRLDARQPVHDAALARARGTVQDAMDKVAEVRRSRASLKAMDRLAEVKRRREDRDTFARRDAL